LLGGNEEDLENEIKIVKLIRKEITINFGLEEYAWICLKTGRVRSKIYIGSTFEKAITELDPRETYKYLGIEENHDMGHKNPKGKLKKEYLRRLSIVLGTELSEKNKIQVVESLAVPVLRYGFGIGNWLPE